MNKKKEHPRVFVLSDLSGFGKCALSVAIPVISSCGVEVCTIPTAVLSSNTKFKDFVMVDFTDYLEDYINHWYNLGISADILYCGFISSIKQVEIVEKFIDKFKPSIVLIDPIMGDNGIKYKTFDDELCKAINRLVSRANIITPNMTEACILAGTDYISSNNLDEEYCLELCKKISITSKSKIILKGIEKNNQIINYLYDENEKFIEFSTELLPYKLFGTGDLFASVLVGNIALGYSIEKSIVTASNFVLTVLKESVNYEDYENRGLCFEPYLHQLIKKEGKTCY